MESAYPYRIAWHRPAETHVGTSSRAAILEAMEYDAPTSRARLCTRSGLGTSTVRRACLQLIKEGVLALKYGRDPDSGVSCDLITLGRYPVLPVLELADTYMVYRLCDTLGQSVFATVRDRGGFCTPEDDLATLMGQVSTILRAGTCGLPKSIPLQPPVLLCPSEETAASKWVERVMVTPPAYHLTPLEAAALEMRYHAATRVASSILHRRVGDAVSIALLARDPTHRGGGFFPLPCANGLGDALAAQARRATPHTREWWYSASEFLTDLCRYLTPDRVVVEMDRPVIEPAELREHLPPSVQLVFLQYALNTPSLAHRGAIRLTRRALWDQMERPAAQT